jgi:hypothetical protein
MTPQVSDLAHALERLARLEHQAEGLQRQNRRLKSAGAVVVLSALAFGLWGHPRPDPGASAARAADAPGAKGKTVEAESFVVRDADGQGRAMLTATAEGASLVLLERGFKPGARKSIVLLTVAKEGPHLDLSGSTGKRRVLLHATEDTGLILSDGDGKERAALSLTKVGPGLLLSDGRDSPRAGLTVTGNGSGLDLIGVDGKQRISLDLRAALQRLTFIDGSGRPRVGLAVTRDGPGLDLFDEEGKPLFSKP